MDAFIAYMIPCDNVEPLPDRHLRARHDGRPMLLCRVATTQLQTRHLDVVANLRLHLRLIQEAAEAGCNLVVFPELSVTGHNGSSDVIRGAEPLDGPVYQTLASWARKYRIIVGYGFCESFRGTHYNSYALVGPDGLLGVQRKVHASFDEFFRFRQAYEWNSFDLGFARAGVAICHDSDFFETWRILALRGAELILLPHANRKTFAADGTPMFDGAGAASSARDVRAAQRELLAPRPSIPRLHDVMSRDNGVYSVFSDQVGYDGHSTHIGGAYILAPDGSMIAQSRIGLGSTFIHADLDPELLERVRANPVFPLRKRRPETYADLTLAL